MRKEVGNGNSRHEWQIIQYSWNVLEVVSWCHWKVLQGDFAPHRKTFAQAIMANRSGVVRATLTMHCTISFEWRMWDVAQ
jgi:hypothetical protein